MKDAGKDVIKRLLKERNREHEATVRQLCMTQAKARLDRDTAMKQIKVLQEKLRKAVCDRYSQRVYCPYGEETSGMCPPSQSEESDVGGSGGFLCTL